VNLCTYVDCEIAYMNQQVDEITKLRFEFYKNVSTLALATVGGAITIVHTLFSNVADKVTAYIAIGCFIAAAISIHGAQEVLVNRLSPRPHFRSRLMALLFVPRWHSIEAEYVLSGITGVTFGVGLVLFGIFVFR
jgi:hypothetical protein